MTRLLALVWPELRTPEADPRPFEPMLDALDDLSPRVEAVDVGVALVDATGLEPMWGPERRIAARAVMLARGVAPLHVRCGIGDNRWLASLAARLARPERPESPAAFRTLERDELAGLPLDLLPADIATRQRFALFGLVEMRQLAELPRSAIGAQFGAAGERLQALARGDDPRPLVPRRRPARVQGIEAFDPPLEGIGAVGLTLRRLAADLCDDLRQRHRAPGRAVLQIQLEDAPTLRVAQVFPQPALEPDWIARLLLSRVEAAARARSCRGAELTANEGQESAPPWPSGAPDDKRQPGKRDILAVSSAEEQPNGGAAEPRVASVHLALDRLADPASTQLPAFEARAGRWEELRWSLERIRHRFGDGRLWRATVERPHAGLPEDRWRLLELHE